MDEVNMTEKELYDNCHFFA